LRSSTMANYAMLFLSKAMRNSAIVNTICPLTSPVRLVIAVAVFSYTCVATEVIQLFVELKHFTSKSGSTADLEQRGSWFKMSVKTTHQTRVHVSPSLNTTDSLNDLVKY